jgi:hypothetical protein
MTVSVPSLSGPSRPPSARAPWWHFAILASLPTLLSVLNRNWAFQNLGTTDAWYYFGSFIHFPRILRVLPNYPSERVAWILPGYTLVHLLGPVTGVLILHWLVVWACLYLLHYVLLQASDYRTALIGTLLLGCNPFFIGPNGWEYPEGLCMALLLASVALLLRRFDADAPSHDAVFLSGAAWCVMLSLYLVWVIFTPAYVYLMLRAFRGEKFRWTSAIRAIGLSALGGLAGALAMWGVYSAMGGPGFFFTENLRTAAALSQVGNAPWVFPNWYREPTWLAFPALAVCLACVGIVEYFRRPGRFNRAHRDLLWFYLFCAAVMLYMSIRPARLLTFDFKASILVPTVFLTFGLILFRVPETTPNWLFYLVSTLAAAACLAPLYSPGLYELAYHRQFLIPVLVLIVIVTTLRLWWTAHPARWCAGCLLFASASFGLIPSSYSMAWRNLYNGPEITERVARAVRIILTRTPENRFPIFWYQDQTDRTSAEFRGIMCSLITINESMKDFPKVDKKFVPGSHIFMLRERADSTAAATYLMASAGMPVAVRSQDQIESGDISYWMTHLEVEPLSLASVRRGFEPIGQANEQVDFVPTASDIAKPLRIASKPITQSVSGIYQFELRYPAKYGPVKFGAVAENGAWLEESRVPVRDGDDEVAWFRSAVKSGVPVRLAALMQCSARDCPALFEPKLSVMRDSSGANIRAFNLDRGLDAADGNLLPNGGFEAGISGWDGMKGKIRASSKCYSGGCVEFLPLGKELQYLVSWDAVKLEQGKSYEMTAWLRSGNDKPIRLDCGLWDSSRQKWVGHQDFTATSSWSPVKVHIRNDTKQKLSPIFWQSRGDFGPMFVDEIELKEVAPMAKPADQGYTNLIPNGGFEEGLGGWDSQKGKILEGSKCRSGGCVEFLPLGTEMQYLVSWSAAKLTPGKSYELSAWIRSGTGKPLRLDCGVWDSKRQKWVGHEPFTATTEWANLKVHFQNDTSESLSPIFWQSFGDFGSMFVDDVVLKEIATGEKGASSGSGR